MYVPNGCIKYVYIYIHDYNKYRFNIHKCLLFFTSTEYPYLSVIVHKYMVYTATVISFNPNPQHNLEVVLCM